MKYLGIFGFAMCFWACNSTTQQPHIDFNREIRPILSDRCFSCHGPDKEARKGDLRLDLPEAALKQKLESGFPAFTPHKPTRSTALDRILSDDPEIKMPPPESELTLSQEEIDLLTRWVEEGAQYDPHWAFIPPKISDISREEGDPWSQNEIDLYVRRGLKEQGLHPKEEAEKETLLRRVSFDLTGLAPSIAELNAFLKDSSDGAYEAAVDRLLASDAYGEHMAVSWMDLARYADTYGYTVDRYRPAWPWRDWVIQAFNDNMPYDQFVTWQIAGDLLPERSKEQRIATAFNRNHSQNAEGGIVNEEFQVEYVADRAQTFGTAFLGLTMECARCHDHKYDPISQKDYYQLFSYFNQVDESGQITFNTKDMPAPTMFLPDEEVERQMAYLDQAIQKREDSLAMLRKELLNASEFKNWIEVGQFDLKEEPKGKIAHFTLDALAGENLKDKVSGRNVGKVIDPITGRNAEILPELVPGKTGKGMKLNGDDALNFPGIGGFRKSDAFSVGLWVKVPRDLGSGVVFHSNKGGIIYNFKGYQVSVEDNHWDVRLAHAYPYNAIHLKSVDSIQTDRWQHVMLTYDGSGKAAGASLYLNGEKMEMKVKQDKLYKEIIFPGGPKTNLKVGARWRSRGLRGGSVDEVVVYDRELSSLEVGYWAGKQFSFAAGISPLTGTQREALLPLFLSDQTSHQILLDSLKFYRGSLDKLVESVQELMIIEERESYRPTYVLNRGAYDAPEEEVFPLPPEVLTVEGIDYPQNRLGLVKWLFALENPLTARVVVNRLWQQCFGQGLVKTAEDFGNQGSLPIYPELLDYLAIQLVESGWDLKALLRKIVTSSTYRQSSQAEAWELEKDPANEWLGRGPTSRLSAEMMRDHILASSGLLHHKLGGPSVKPYQPEGLWRVNTGKYEPDSGANLYRRSLYTFWKRTVPPPSMNTFDAPSRSYCLVRRQKTHTPLQALTLLNDPQFQEAARVLGQQVIQNQFAPEQGISHIFRRLTSRHPKEMELAMLKEMFKEQQEDFESHPEKQKGWLGVGEYPLPEAYDPAELAAYSVVASTVMNFYETIHK